MHKKIGLILTLSMAIQGCTIVQTSLNGELTGPSPSEDACAVTYSLDLVSGHRTNTFGVRETDPTQTAVLRKEYIEISQSVFSAIGCSANLVDKSKEIPSLKISIASVPQLSALPQEWLTGLSFGIIPSWGTRFGEYRYSFTLKESARKRDYTVDTTTYNHLVLFPIVWVNIFTGGEKEAYETALTNFMQHTE